MGTSTSGAQSYRGTSMSPSCVRIVLSPENFGPRMYSCPFMLVQLHAQNCALTAHALDLLQITQRRSENGTDRNENSQTTLPVCMMPCSPLITKTGTFYCLPGRVGQFCEPRGTRALGGKSIFFKWVLALDKYINRKLISI